MKITSEKYWSMHTQRLFSGLYYEGEYLMGNNKINTCSEVEVLKRGK